MRHEPVGTNLLTATQAEEMVRYILGDLLSEERSRLVERIESIPHVEFLPQEEKYIPKDDIINLIKGE